MLAEAKYSLVYRNHLEMRVSEPLCDRQAHVMSVRADLGAMLLIVGRTLSAVAADTERRPAALVKQPAYY
jgi:hypothetical protein